MDDGLRKKILYAVCAGIIVLFGVVAVLLLFRKQPKQTVMTRTEYLQTQPTPAAQPVTDIRAFLPPITSTQSGTPLADRTGSSSSSESTSSDVPLQIPPSTTTTTSVDKAWAFFRQSIGLPITLVTAIIPGVSSCGNANQPVCTNSQTNVTIIRNETQVTNITFIQEVVDIPLSILDKLQDIVFYKFVALLQQTVLANDTYPRQTVPEHTSWFSDLIARGEMSQFYYDVFTRTNAPAANCGTVQQQGFCYESNGTSANLYVRQRAGTSECPRGAIKSWNSDKNALQVTCF